MPWTISPKNKKDTTEEEKLVAHCTLIRKSLWRAKRSGKMKTWRRLTKKKAWHSRAILDSRLSENVEDIGQCFKIFHGTHEKLESVINSKRKKLCWGRNTDDNLPERCALAINLCNSNDTTLEVHWWLQIFKIIRND